MPRDYKLYLEDILDAIKSIEEYTKELDITLFQNKKMAVDAVVRNLEIIGEAAKNIPPNIREKYQQIEWKKITGLRDILAHQYFGIDIDILWDIVKTKLPALKNSLKELL